jgi:hypothetical protein
MAGECNAQRNCQGKRRYFSIGEELMRSLFDDKDFALAIKKYRVQAGFTLLIDSKESC